MIDGRARLVKHWLTDGAATLDTAADADKQSADAQAVRGGGREGAGAPRWP